MATEQQIPKLVGSIVEHQTAFQSLSTDDAQWVIAHTKDAIALLCEAISKGPRFLTHRSYRMEAMPHGFYAGEMFMLVEGGVVYLGPEHIQPTSELFSEWFLRGGGVIEAPREGRRLSVRSASRSSTSASLRKAVKEVSAEIHTFLSEICELIHLSYKTPDILLAQGVNVFYVLDRNGLTRELWVKYDALSNKWTIYPVPDQLLSSQSVVHPEGTRVFTWR